MQIQRGGALIEHILKKHPIRIIFLKNKFAHTRELFKENNILNIHKLKLMNHDISVVG